MRQCVYLGDWAATPIDRIGLLDELANSQKAENGGPQRRGIFPTPNLQFSQAACAGNILDRSAQAKHHVFRRPAVVHRVSPDTLRTEAVGEVNACQVMFDAHPPVRYRLTLERRFNHHQLGRLRLAQEEDDGPRQHWRQLVVDQLFEAIEVVNIAREVHMLRLIRLADELDRLLVLLGLVQDELIVGQDDEKDEGQRNAPEAGQGIVPITIHPEEHAGQQTSESCSYCQATTPLHEAVVPSSGIFDGLTLPTSVDLPFVESQHVVPRNDRLSLRCMSE